MQQKAENDYETMYNELKKENDLIRKFRTGCETYETAQIDHDDRKKNLFTMLATKGLILVMTL